jgi:hypothetical protein
MQAGWTHWSTSTWESGPLPSPIMRQGSRITRDPGAHDACFTRESDRLVRRWHGSRPGCGPRRTPIHRDGRGPGRDSLPSTTGMRAHPRPGPLCRVEEYMNKADRDDPRGMSPRDKLRYRPIHDINLVEKILALRGGWATWACSSRAPSCPLAVGSSEATLLVLLAATARTRIVSPDPCSVPL